jgi:tetratricopeptide (TPR) repeat protein
MSTRRVVMISSTARDLPEHREQVRLACERVGFAPHDMMEHLTALDADSIQASLRLVDEAEVYVGILAYRYGYVPDGHDMSITEMEYNRAVRRNIPRLIFFIHEDHPVTGKDVETGPGAAKLTALKERIGKARVAAFFKSPDDLRAHVVEALTTLGKELYMAASGGDATAGAVAKLHRKSSMPAPPEPYIAHPYTLLQSRDLVGRQAELNALTDWVANPASSAFSARVFCFVAIGGVGKSALAWQWFNQIAPKEMKPLAGRLWWSFYESDADFENFLIRALSYAGGESEATVRALLWPEREAQLLRHLNEEPYLLVLDGLERILIAYHRMDASYLANDEYDEQCANYVAGAVGLPHLAAQSFVGQHRLRRTTDPRAGAFIQKLAQVAKSRVLVTTRLYPSELQISTGHPRPGCFPYFLPGLSDDDALSFWRALNVRGSRVELLPIFRSVEGHPLLVQALASEVANYRKEPGDFTKWRSDHPQFDPVSLPLVQSRTHILEFALKGLSAKVRDVLDTLVGFRMPTSYATLEALLVGQGKACDTAYDLDRTLTELEDRGLIGWDREANRYDAHPIVRGVVWRLTDAKDQREIYTAVEAHFKPMVTPNWREVATLADLTPAIERYHTLVGLKRYDDAWDIFFERLYYATYYRLAAHRQRTMWLELLFSSGTDGLPTLTDTRRQSKALGALANSYYFSGQPWRAASLFRRAYEAAGQWFDIPEQGMTPSDLSIALLDIGALREAVSVARRALVLSRESKFRFWEGLCLQHLGRLFTSAGELALSHVTLHRSKSILRELVDRSDALSVTTGLLADRSLRMGDAINAQILSEEASELAGLAQSSIDYVMLRRAKIALGRLDFADADHHLHQALTRSRHFGDVGLELSVLVAIAELELQRRHPMVARAQLEEVWEASEAGPYRLHQADAYNVLADIEMAEGNKPAAIAATTRAYRAAWCDGPPYAYYWGLAKAKARLAALGAPEPDMPPFDESNFEPMTEVDFNPKDEYWVNPASLD